MEIASQPLWQTVSKMGKVRHPFGEGPGCFWGRSEKSVATFTADYGTQGPQSHFGWGWSKVKKRTFPTPPSE